jgi:hypothetical protein
MVGNRDPSPIKTAGSGLQKKRAQGGGKLLVNKRFTVELALPGSSQPLYERVQNFP